MPRLNEALRRAIKPYEEELKLRGRSQKHIKDQIRAVRRGCEILRKYGMDCAPSNMTREHLNKIRAELPPGKMNPGSPRNAQFHVDAMRMFLRFHENKIPPLAWQDYVRNTPMTPKEHYLKALKAAEEAGDWQAVALLLIEGLTSRRIGIERLIEGMMQEYMLEDGYLLVRDKGKAGGKTRKLKFTPDIARSLRWCEEMRRKDIARVLRNNPKAKIPQELIIWTRVNTMGGCKRTSLDNILIKAGIRVGVKLNHHAIRRMSCRDVYVAAKAMNAPMKAVLDQTGHKKEQDLYNYVGVFEEEQSNIMEAVMKSRNELKQRLALTSA